MLIDEHNLTKFNVLLDQFIQHWISKEPDFINYFKQQYQSRPGELNITGNTLTNRYPQPIIIEKWAKCHRHFPHANTDTNMYLER